MQLLMNQYQYDQNHTRYKLVKSSPDAEYNWLFLPGGPGSDSSYFTLLTDHLTLPGNYWHIDLPGNGDNISDILPEDYDYGCWQDCLLAAVKNFENPILVGHSFGGMLPLMLPDLEDLLSGFVILNSAPRLWLLEAAKAANENNLPDLTPAMDEFTSNPSRETHQKAF